MRDLAETLSILFLTGVLVWSIWFVTSPIACHA